MSTISAIELSRHEELLELWANKTKETRKQDGELSELERPRKSNEEE